MKKLFVLVSACVFSPAFAQTMCESSVNKAQIAAFNAVFCAADAGLKAIRRHSKSPYLHSRQRPLCFGRRYCAVRLQALILIKSFSGSLKQIN